MNFNKDMLLLYAVTDRSLAKNKSFYEQIEKALMGGITTLQLREKNLNEEDFIKEAIMVKKLCEKYDVPLIINDNLTVALESGADGVHVGAEDMTVAEIRESAPRGFIIGATAKTVAQAQAAERDGADYLGVGAVFPSPTKKEAVRITTQRLKEITSSVAIPAVAIGGICAENVAQLKGGGMCGIAAVSAIFGAENITEAAENLKNKVIQVI